MGPESPCVNDAFRDSLMVEVEDFLSQVKIFQGRRSPCADFEGILIVGNRRTLLRGEDWHAFTGDLVKLSTRRGLTFGTDILCFRVSLLSHGFCPVILSLPVALVRL